MDNTYVLQTRRGEYLKKLDKSTTPLYIEGIYSIYKNVKKQNTVKKFLLKEFQQSMADVSRWSNDMITTEYGRFKKNVIIIDKLIQSIFEVDVTLHIGLSKNAKKYIPKPCDYVHQCYLNIARHLWKQPFLVYDVNIDKLEIQKNKMKIEKIVGSCIRDTFSQFLPLDDDEYGIDENEPTNENEPENVTLDDVLSEEVEDFAEDAISENNTSFEIVQSAPSVESFESESDDIELDVPTQELTSTNSVQDEDEPQYESDVDTNNDVDDDVIGSDDDINSLNEFDEEEDNEEFNDEELHIPDESEVESVKSDTFYVPRITHDEQEEEETPKHESPKYDIRKLSNVHSTEIKEVYIGPKQEKNEDVYIEPSNVPQDVKIVNIDESRERSRHTKNASLLSIKKKVKSAINNDKRLVVERKNTSFF